MATWQVSIWFCIYNKSAVIEHQFTVCGLFGFVYFVCARTRTRAALGSCFHNCWKEPKYWNSAAGCSNSN